MSLKPKLVKKALAVFDNAPMETNTSWTREQNRQWRVNAMEAALLAAGLPVWNDFSTGNPQPNEPVWLYDSMFGTIVKAHGMPLGKYFDPDYSHWMHRQEQPDPPWDGKIHANLSRLPKT